ncbi:DUF1365 domain-containing protein [Alteromonas sediminis]|uniref:DUF1365 domain-containing protein n=1 Tax=Alteromonas sediminis TaxID=2259342 RepID=A0A3N5YLM5_9ALTE|nr:DUF1365 domain-containing protein [Alteromonas sediminis]RPJ66101.1 DUF1365 domain-containing protein [Alteromonas sediminis]
MIESAIYQGKVHHERVHPTQHSFEYALSLFWLKLDELPHLTKSLRHFSISRLSFHRFKLSDYFVHKDLNSTCDLIEAIKERMVHLGATSALDGDIFFLGQLRSMGIYFSPVNFYYHRNEESQVFDYMLAEVSNTPWNEKHYYLVDLKQQHDTQKTFHVSPFNPIDMTYKWQVSQPDERLSLALSCYQEHRHFTASIAMKKQPLTDRTLRALTLKMPSTTLFSLIGIYWQALKLFIKRTPVYGHPGSIQSHVQENNNVTK